MYRNPEDLADQAHLSTPLSKPKEAPPVSRLLSASVSETKCDKPMNENIQNISRSSNKSDKPESVEIPSLVQKEHSKDSISIKEEKIKESCVNKDTSPTDLNSNNKSGMLSKSNEMKNKPLEQNMKLDSDHMDIDASSEVEDIGAIHYVSILLLLFAYAFVYNFCKVHSNPVKTHFMGLDNEQKKNHHINRNIEK